MSVHCTCRGALLGAVGLLLAAPMLWASPAAAQDGTMKVCGEKWQAAKAAGTTGGTTWPKFLAECRSGSSKPEAAKAEPAKASPAKEEAGKTTAAKTPAPQPTGAIVFPTAVSSKFSTLSAGRARRKTCSEQYQANKANNANGGLKWLEKGGGYWSLCNAKLKT